MSIRCAIALQLALAWAGAADAQVDLLSPDTIHGVVDVGAAAANGEPSFTADGFGKSRFGGDGAVTASGGVENATLEWVPRFGWDLHAVVDLIYQPGQEHPIDIDQAYLVYKPVPTSATRFQVRAGYFYPPVSLENDFRAWGVTNTITPSAIDSWIGEEVKVAGVEVTVSHDFGDQRVGLTAGVFTLDDTAGALLAYRGWALDDTQSQANGSFDLPPLSPFLSKVQLDESYSALDIDNRAGVYGRLDWKPIDGLALNGFYYNNRGDMTGETSNMQWAWATSFWEAGGRWEADDRTTVMSQALTGHTVTGYQTSAGRFVDMDFRSAYLLGTRLVGKSAFTARVDVFDTTDLSGLSLGNTNERGWATTAAWRYPLNKFVDLRLEALRIDSDRPGRLLAGEDSYQAQTVLQSRLRLTF